MTSIFFVCPPPSSCAPLPPLSLSLFFLYPRTLSFFALHALKENKTRKYLNRERQWLEGGGGGGFGFGPGNGIKK